MTPLEIAQAWAEIQSLNRGEPIPRRKLFFAGRISPRFPRAVFIYGGVDPFMRER